METPFQIGPWLVSPKLNQIAQIGRTIHLEPKIMSVLVCLAEHKCEVVSKEQLFATVWPDTFVTDDVLKRSISELRKALGDDTKEPRFIETIPKGGYRLICPVNEFESAGRLTPLHQLSPVVLRLALAFAVVLVIAGGYFAWRTWRTPRPPNYAKIVVLPFVNLSSDPQQEYFSDGLTEEMISQLGSLQPEHLGVVARTTAMQYKGAKKTAQEIGRELGVDYILESSVQRAEDRVRISTQLIRASDQTQLWSQSYDRDLSDILFLRRDIAEAISRGVGVKAAPKELVRRANARPVNPEAYEAYLKGRYYWNKRDGQSLQKALGLFQQSTKIDPQNALAYAGLADTYYILAAYHIIPNRETIGKAKAAAAEAVELDDTLAEAHTSVAMASMLDYDWSAAEKEYKRAIELNPNYALAHHLYADYLGAIGRVEECIAESKRARDLEPLSLLINTVLGMRLSGDLGIQQLQKALELDPNYALTHIGLGYKYMGKGMHEQAIEEMQKGVTLSGELPEWEMSLAEAYARAGRKKEAREILKKLQTLSERTYVSPYHIARAYVALGEKDKAIAWLEKSYGERAFGLRFIKRGPSFDPLRNDPRFQDLLRRMNFPPAPVKQ